MFSLYLLTSVSHSVATKANDQRFQWSRTYPSYSIVLMMKPNVGLTVLTSSPIIFFTMVVLPALSSPLFPRKHKQAHKD
jgi:hypothetical protein